jgi:hypothetical protein
MPLHLIMLCVGVDAVDDLRRWQARRAAEGRPPIVHTRQTPKRAADLLDGGSLYWVIRGQIMVRQTILAIETLGEGAARRCEIRLDPPLKLTAPQPRRAFQGWRYFEPKDAPPDLAGGEDAGELPQGLARELRELGAW